MFQPSVGGSSSVSQFSFAAIEPSPKAAAPRHHRSMAFASGDYRTTADGLSGRSNSALVNDACERRSRAFFNASQRER